jgi:hypothetical protein
MRQDDDGPFWTATVLVPQPYSQPSLPLQIHRSEGASRESSAAAPEPQPLGDCSLLSNQPNGLLEDQSGVEPSSEAVLVKGTTAANAITLDEDSGDALPELTSFVPSN